MICPHCSTAAKFQWKFGSLHEVEDVNETAVQVFYDSCPNCYKLVVGVQSGEYETDIDNDYYISDVTSKEIVYPQVSGLQNSNLIPKKYLEDYEEAVKVLSLSSKASAALTRRLLQNILREEFNISEKSLAKEIEIFTNKTDIPSYITDAVDAVRQVGNIAAHPLKDLSTGEIVPVEKGEAEWLIEVIEQLFDFVFIQPKKLEKRKQELNLKLDKIGKPQMK